MDEESLSSDEYRKMKKWEKIIFYFVQEENKKDPRVELKNS